MKKPDNSIGKYAYSTFFKKPEVKRDKYILNQEYIINLPDIKVTFEKSISNTSVLPSHSKEDPKNTEEETSLSEGTTKNSITKNNYADFPGRNLESVDNSINTNIGHILGKDFLFNTPFYKFHFDLDRYCSKYLSDLKEYLKLITSFKYRDTPIYFDKLFVNMTLKTKNSDINLTVHDIYSMLQNDIKIVISAPIGYGKSMFIKKLLFDFIKKQLKSREILIYKRIYNMSEKIPIYLSAKKYESIDKNTDLEHILIKELFSFLPETPDIEYIIHEYLPKGKFIIFIDDIERLNSINQQKFFKQLRVTATKYKKNNFLIAKNTSTDSTEIDNIFNEIYLNPLSEQKSNYLTMKLAAYLKLSTNKKTQLLDCLSKYAFLKYYPLLLTIFILTFKKCNGLVENFPIIPNISDEKLFEALHDALSASPNKFNSNYLENMALFLENKTINI